MTKALDNITKEDFIAYEKVRARGRWNMFDPKAHIATGLDEETFFAIIRHYSELAAKWPDVRKGDK